MVLQDIASPGWLARARARAYALLALGLRPPTADLVEQLASGTAWEGIRALCPPGELDGALASLGAAMAPYRGEDGLVALQVLYQRLFAGPGAVAPPYGSLYLEGRLMGETTVAVLKAYGRAGLAVADDLRDLPDHAAVEAEFLCELLWRELEAWEAGDLAAAGRWLGEELSFLEEHLGRWFPAFAARLNRVAEPGPYGLLLRAGSAFVSFDRRLAEQVLSWACSPGTGGAGRLAGGTAG